ncbi:MAG: hypothetical protein RL095_3881 [Verrucomicrobiota bacterium]|jgi:hypothetical protein
MLHRALALLLLSSVAACSERSPAPVKKPKLSSKAAPAAAQVVARPLPERLGELSLPELTCKGSLAELVDLWRNAVIAKAPELKDLPFAYLLDSAASGDFKLPAGPARQSLEALAKELKMSLILDPGGILLAPPPKWEYRAIPVPGSEEMLKAVEEKGGWAAYLKPFNAEIPEDGLIDREGTTLHVVLPPEQANKLASILRPLCFSSPDLTLEQLNLEIPRQFLIETDPQTHADWAAILRQPQCRILHRDFSPGRSGFTGVIRAVKEYPGIEEVERGVGLYPDADPLSGSIPVANCGVYSERINFGDPVDYGRVLTFTPTLDPDGVALDIETKWQEKILRVPNEPRPEDAHVHSVDTKIRQRLGDYWELTRELSADGQSFTVQLLRIKSLVNPEPPWAAAIPASWRSRLNDVLPPLAGVSPVAALQAWSQNAGWECRIQGQMPDLKMNSQGALSVGACLRLLESQGIFIEFGQANWTLSGPQKELNFPRGDAAEYLVDSGLFGKSSERTATGIRFDKLSPSSWLFLQSRRQALKPFLSPMLRLESYEVAFTDIATMDLERADLPRHIAALKDAKLELYQPMPFVFGQTFVIRQVESKYLPFDWSSPSLLDPASGRFLPPEPEYRDARNIGPIFEATIKCDSDNVDMDFKFSHLSLNETAKYSLKAQLSGKPEQKFSIEMPIIQVFSVESQASLVAGRPRLLAIRESSPGRVRLVFATLLPARN